MSGLAVERILSTFRMILAGRLMPFAIGFVLLAGLAGYYGQDAIPGDYTPRYLLRVMVYSFIKALKLFAIPVPSYEDDEGTLLVLARLVATVVASVAVLRIVMSLVADDAKHIASWFYSGHVVVFGCGRKSISLVSAPRKLDGRRLVLFDKEAVVLEGTNAIPRSTAFLHKLTPSVLPAVSRPRSAATFVVATGSDELNLAIARRIIVARDRARSSSQIFLDIGDANLATRIESNHQICRPKNGDEVKILNESKLVARSLLQRTVFSDLALQLGQERVHLVFVGLTDDALEILTAYLRISPCLGLKQPLIDIFESDRNEAIRRLLDRAPNLLYAIEGVVSNAQRSTPMGWAVRIRVFEHEPTDMAHDRAVWPEGDIPTNITAVIVASPDPIRNIRVGLRIRDELAPEISVAGPVYVRVRERTSLEELLVRNDGLAPPAAEGSQLAALRGSRDMRRVIEPFGVIEEIYNTSLIIGEREERAKYIHEAYQRIGGALDSPDNVGNVAWNDLRETYRQANRRVADHVPVKLLSLGEPRWWNALDLSLLQSGKIDDVMWETQAELEHQSWRIDRELDGWRYGEERDNERLRHPDLVEYEALGASAKRYDLAMVRTVFGNRS